MVVAALAIMVGLYFQLSIDLKGESVFTPQFLFEFFGVFIVAPFVIAGIKIVHGEVTHQSWATIKSNVKELFAPQMLLRVFISFVCIYIVVTVFGAVKSLIGLTLTPNGHDILFIGIERFLHGGKLPHEYFTFIYDNPQWLYRIDFFYWLWFILMYVFLAWAVFQPKGTPGRLQYLLSFCLCWTVIGNVLAALGASAGPVFWHYYLPGPDPYESLLATLNALNAQEPLFRTGFRDIMLSMMHNDRMIDLNGPAALPSVHVAMACLFALYSYKYWRLMFVFTLVYLIIIQLGSFLLAWHYAIDGYVGIAAMLLIWWGAGWVDRQWRVTSA